MTTPRNLTVVLFFATPGTTWGGMEKHTADLAQALIRRGHSVHIIGHKSYRHHFSADACFHPAPVQLGRRNPWLRLLLKRRFHRIAPDIIHAQGNKAAQLIGSAKSEPRYARVGTVHGSKSSHHAFRHLDKVIAVSQQIYDSLEHSGKQLIFNGIATPPSEALESKGEPLLSRDAINVVAIGRLEPVKGFPNLVRAWAELAERSPRAHLTIFGEGSQRKELEELIASLKLDARVALAGFRADLAGVYREADLVVISSEREGFPYVLTESLLARCPVVATPVSGAASLLPQQALSPDHRVTSLANLLIDALDDLPALNAAEEPAMAFASDRLTLKRMADDTERLYFDVLTATHNQNR